MLDVISDRSLLDGLGTGSSVTHVLQQSTRGQEHLQLFDQGIEGTLPPVQRRCPDGDHVLLVHGQELSRDLAMLPETGRELLRTPPLELESV